MIDVRLRMLNPAKPASWQVTTGTDDNIRNNFTYGGNVDYWKVDLLNRLDDAQVAGLASLLAGLLSNTMDEMVTRSLLREKEDALSTVAEG